MKTVFDAVLTIQDTVKYNGHWMIQNVHHVKTLKAFVQAKLDCLSQTSHYVVLYYFGLGYEC